MFTTAHAGDFNVVPAYKPVTWPSSQPSRHPVENSAKVTADQDPASVQELLAYQAKMAAAASQVQDRQEAILPIGKIVSIAQNPKTLTAIGSLANLTQGPNATVFYGVEAGWFVLMLIIRTLKIRKSRNGFQGLWIQFYMTVIYIIGGSVLIPFFFLSSETRKMLLSLL